ncbi:hypothetical protein [Alicyclobacillus sendaiensis]|uniref:Transmembrane protein n=1 Tax=Alicyclobacillus sendaiensis PA2 TaxID=3029425 RepID=A0ABT6XV29_ALISE|nr:hypothetical protein [Alicyclobacillus sendaiensis]MDI9258944.1 hypothetical protein [Alicyclobacillus sendaiensis PA2]
MRKRRPNKSGRGYEGARNSIAHLPDLRRKSSTLFLFIPSNAVAAQWVGVVFYAYLIAIHIKIAIHVMIEIIGHVSFLINIII